MSKRRSRRTSVGGHQSGPYGGAADLERRYGIGLEQVAKYVDYATRAELEVVWITPDGTPAIELAFDIDLDGILIRGFIDAVIKQVQSDGT